jgi:hypothetical protein
VYIGEHLVPVLFDLAMISMIPLIWIRKPQDWDPLGWKIYSINGKLATREVVDEILEKGNLNWDALSVTSVLGHHEVSQTLQGSYLL